MSPFITRVVVENYKSIAACDVRLGPLTVLVGLNGSGKSTFLDALRVVRDVCNSSLTTAVQARGGPRAPSTRAAVLMSSECPTPAPPCADAAATPRGAGRTGTRRPTRL